MYLISQQCWAACAAVRLSGDMPTVVIILGFTITTYKNRVRIISTRIHRIPTDPPFEEFGGLLRMASLKSSSVTKLPGVNIGEFMLTLKSMLNR